jgi:dTDP-4-dehydrorhamnose reductase
MKVFITGGSGLLGSALCYHFAKKWQVICGYHSHPATLKINNVRNAQINIIDQNSLEAVKSVEPDVVIHAAALTNLEYCEANPKEAYIMNVAGTQNVVEVCNKTNAKIVYINTDYVFDGKKGNYAEQDETNPLSVYAKTKLEGEQIVCRNSLNYLSVRTSFHGWALNKHSISSSIIDSFRNHKSVRAATDQRNSIMYTLDLAEILMKMLEKDLEGIYHVASSNSMSRYEFALCIAKTFGLDSKLAIPTPFQTIATVFNLKTARPEDVSLNANKIESVLERMPTIEEGLVKMKLTENLFRGIRD